ncbi:ABC transporter permease [Flexithrix dorotheae]|uniref:ABC transporter permease n=1 Tax=Flexithrix dorotheae TaxID=70993 RepID=UPI00037898CE|nr:FtsX-like permease family protein [Flexithrix dorotheae]
MDRFIKIKRKKVHLFKSGWIWRTAWNDAKKHLGRLSLFISSIVIGIAALVAINSFNFNLKKDIDNQAKALLGADLVLYSENNFYEADSLHFDTLPYPQAEDARFSSMVSFPNLEESRLAQIVAIKGRYPFYGEMKTEPAGALERFHKGGVAILDDNMALEYNILPGDYIKVGDLQLPVAGVVTKIPGNIKIAGTIAPSVYIPYEKIEKTGLLKKGSRVNYRKYFKNYGKKTGEALLAEIKPIINKHGYGYETVSYRKESLSSGFENLYRFFNLLGFVALILGSLGVASSVHIYTREKINTVAILRCIGASGNIAFQIFFLQILFLGLIGNLIGITLGHFIQLLIPYILQDFIPVALNFSVSWFAIIEGFIVGIIITILFSTLPLINIKYTSPLAVLRSFPDKLKGNRNIKRLIFVLILVFNWAFAIVQTNDLQIGSFFFLGLLVTLLCLILVANLLIFMIKKLSPKQIGFVWKQSLANLFRPNNQTAVLMVVIGLGAFLVATVTSVQDGILNQVAGIGNKTRSNLILFDIQPNQTSPTQQLVEKFEIEQKQLVPIVTLRLNKLKGQTLSEVRENPEENIPNWLLYMEYIVTYRDHLLASESIIEGKIETDSIQANDSIYVSITETIANQLSLKVGDEVNFNLQGVNLNTFVGSIRKVDWQEVQTNFAFVFPKGVLEQAPQYFAMLLNSPTKQTSAKFKQKLSNLYPNISTVDLSLIVRTLDDVMNKIAFAIRFMAMFSIITGLLVLAGSVANSKFAKIKENTLLRTLGAMQKQLISITILEYGYLGFLAALTGVLLSFGAIWGLSIYFLDLFFTPNLLSIGLIILAITFLTTLISWLNLRGIVSHSPLEVLQKEM